VVVDGDRPLDLDTIASLSRAASEQLDALEESDPGATAGAATYVLEVSSPGVDRPLTTERHYRRARGRKVELTLSDGSQLTGRVGALTDGGRSVSLVVREGARANFSVRELPLEGIVKAVVQVEFSPPSQRELELTGQSAEEAGA
jgi:ribosome maturation factor RimP